MHRKDDNITSLSSVKLIIIEDNIAFILLFRATGMFTRFLTNEEDRIDSASNRSLVSVNEYSHMTLCTSCYSVLHHNYPQTPYIFTLPAIAYVNYSTVFYFYICVIILRETPTPHKNSRETYSPPLPICPLSTKIPSRKQKTSKTMFFAVTNVNASLQL